MAGRGEKARIVRPPYPGVRFQEVRHGSSILNVPVHADGQRLDPPEQEEGVQRAENAAVGVPCAHDLFTEIGVPGRDDAGQGVAVAAEVFRGAVQHDVGSVVHGPEQMGGQERVVDHDLRAGRVGIADDRGRVDDVQGGIGQRLEVDDVGGLFKGRVELFRIAHVDDLDVEPEAWQFFGHEAPRPAIGRLVADDPGARADEGHHGLGDRSHAAGRGDAASSAFQGTHLLLECRERGIASPEVGAVHRGRLVDRRCRRVLRLARVDGACDESLLFAHGSVL